jgi:hypothetical protein
MTVKASRKAATGSHSITITATGGSAVQTGAVTVDITAN